jgi:hypothetical protein
MLLNLNNEYSTSVVNLMTFRVSSVSECRFMKAVYQVTFHCACDKTCIFSVDFVKLKSCAA